MKKVCIVVALLLILTSCRTMGEVSETGGEPVRWAIEPQYSFAKSFCDGVALVLTDDDMWMFIDSENKNEFSKKFAYIEDAIFTTFFGDTLPVVYETKGSTPYLLDRDGTAVPPSEHKIALEYITLAKEDYRIVVSDNGLMGVVNKRNQWIVPPEYKNISCQNGVIHILGIGKDGYGFIAENGEVVFLEDVKFVGYFTNGYALVEGDMPPEEISHYHPTLYWYNYVDMEGNYVLARPLYEEPAGISEGIITYKEHGLYGCMDTNGTVLIPPMYPYAGLFSDGVVLVENEKGEIGYVNLENEVVVPFQKASYGCEFQNGYAPLEVVGKRYRLIDKTGKRITADKYTFCYCYEDINVWKLQASSSPDRTDVFFPDKMCLVGTFDFIGQILPTAVVGSLPNAQKTSLVDVSSGETIWYDFDYIDTFSEGLAPALLGEKYGYIDIHGNWVYAPQFDQAEPFSEGLAAVCVDGKWGYVLNPLAAETAG